MAQAQTFEGRTLDTSGAVAHSVRLTSQPGENFTLHGAIAWFVQTWTVGTVYGSRCVNPRMEVRQAGGEWVNAVEYCRALYADRKAA